MTTSLSKILITGAMGNVGMAVIKALQKQHHLLDIIARVRDLEADSKKLAAYCSALMICSSIFCN